MFKQVIPLPGYPLTPYASYWNMLITTPIAQFGERGLEHWTSAFDHVHQWLNRSDCTLELGTLDKEKHPYGILIKAPDDASVVSIRARHYSHPHLHPHEWDVPVFVTKNEK